MPAWAIVLILIGAVVVIAALAVGAKRARDEQLERRRAEARELRQEADQRYGAAKEIGAAAEMQAQQAHRERAAAAMAARHAE